MKILITADLHNRRDWYEWLLIHAHRYDAIAIAGDLLDARYNLAPQIAFIGKWVRRVSATGTRLFLCDGNHDNNRSVPGLNMTSAAPNAHMESYDSLFPRRWLDALDTRMIRVSGTNTILHHQNDRPHYFTCCRYEPADEAPNRELLEIAWSFRQSSHRRLTWIVLHHELPQGTLGSYECASPYLSRWIADYQPDYVLCGHDHSISLRNGFCAERRGRTLVINPGQRFTEPYPAHVILDTDTSRTEWKR